MTTTLTGQLKTRREAELTVERLVQEYASIERPLSWRPQVKRTAQVLSERVRTMRRALPPKSHVTTPLRRGGSRDG
jgi:hypothetical protein